MFAREELSALSPNALSWGSDDEDDTTRSTKPKPSKNEASSSAPKQGLWAKRLNGTSEAPKQASVRDLTRREKKTANETEKRQTKKTQELNVKAVQAQKTESGSRESREVSTAVESTCADTSASSSGFVAFTFFALLRLLAFTVLLFTLFTTAVYLDANFPTVWPPVWRLKRFNISNLSVSEALDFALGVVKDVGAATSKKAKAAITISMQEKDALVVFMTKKAAAVYANVQSEVTFIRVTVECVAKTVNAFMTEKMKPLGR